MTELSALSQPSDLGAEDNAVGTATELRSSLDLLNETTTSASTDLPHWPADSSLTDSHLRTDLGGDPLGDASHQVLPTESDFSIPIAQTTTSIDLDDAPSLPVPQSLSTAVEQTHPTDDQALPSTFTDPLDSQAHDSIWQGSGTVPVQMSTDTSQPSSDQSGSQGLWAAGSDQPHSLLNEFNGIQPSSSTVGVSATSSSESDSIQSSSQPLPLPLPLPASADLTTSSLPLPPTDFSFIDSATAAAVDDSDPLPLDLTSDSKELPSALSPDPLGTSNEMPTSTQLPDPSGALSPGGAVDPVELSAFSPRRATSGSGQLTADMSVDAPSWAQTHSSFGLTSQPNGHSQPTSSEMLLSQMASLSGIPAQVLSELQQQLQSQYSRRPMFPGYTTFDPNATSAAARPPPPPAGPGPIDLTDDEPVIEEVTAHAPRKPNQVSTDVHTVSERGREFVLLDDDDEFDDDDVFEVSPRGTATQSEQGDHLYGAISSFIVGTKYCYAVVQPGETVYLQRDKSNPFDANTHAVVNKIGSRAGFLARDTNSVLAPLLFGDSIRVEVTVQSPAYDDRLPINIAVYGSYRDRMRIEQTLSAAPISYMPGVAVSPIFTARYAMQGAGATPLGLLGAPITEYTAIGTGPSVSEIETNLDKYFENAAVDFENIPESDAKLLQTPLHPYQKQGLYWMIQKEGQTYTDEAGKHLGWEKQTRQGKTVYINKATNVSRETPPTLYRGGVLADEMGLGKTLQVLALIMSNSGRGDCTCGAAAAVSKKLSASASSSSAKASKASKSSKPAKKRQKTPHDSDSDSSGSISPSPSGANEHSAGNCARPAGPTLIVCPLSVITNWQDQIETHVLPDHCSFYTYHGPNRMKDAAALATFDVVITTYTVLSTEFTMPATEKKKKANFSVTDVTSASSQKETKSRKRKAVTDSPLFAIEWLRVVLDEAHIIRDPKTRQSLAAAALRSSYRWSVTGTPFQNKVDDAFALLRFLQLEPFNVQSVWSKMIMKPLKNREEKGLQRLQNIMGAITLRRKKNESIHGKAILTLPTKTQRVRYIELEGEERDLYRALATDGKNRVGSLLKSDQAMRHYAVVLEILLRMRQACDHVDLVPENYKKYGFANMSEDERAEVRRLVTLLEDSPEDDCSICLNAVEDAVVTPCGHFYCRKCLEQSLAATPSCPLCRQSVVWSKVVTSDTRKEIDLEEKKSAEAAAASSAGPKWSAKVSALFEELDNSFYEDSTCKSVVFSQWTAMLDVLERCFKARGVGLVRLDGRMSAAGRKHALRAFRDDPKVKVFLISLKAGGVGLNLTAGNKVYMMDPWWNPSAEDQAVDRVHRLGQTKPVEIVRFCVKGSIEDKILELQNHKRKIMASAMVRLGKKRQESKDERLQDLMFLFGERGSLTSEISGPSSSSSSSGGADPDSSSSARSSNSSPPAAGPSSANGILRPSQSRSAFEPASRRSVPSQSLATPSPAPPQPTTIPWADPRSAFSADQLPQQGAGPGAVYWDPQAVNNALNLYGGHGFPNLSAFSGGFVPQFPR